MAFSVMTWNVENLFTPGPMQGSKKEIAKSGYEGKLEYLAGVFLKEKPAVVALQELGRRKDDAVHPLDDLQSLLDDLYPYAAPAKYHDSRGIGVGFLSQLEILSDPGDDANNPVTFPEGSELSQVPDWKGKHLVRMGRGALKIDVEAADGFTVRLVTCHLKSKLITYPSDTGGARFAPRDENERAVGESLALFRRTAEAGTIRMYISRLMQAEPGVHTIVLGDLNDEPGAATTQQILGPADRDVTTDDKLDAVRLYNLGDAIPCKGAAEKTFLAPDRAFSRIYNDRRELIDHILVSKSLLGKTADMRKDLWQVQEARCLVEKITTIGDNPGDRIGDIVPDHAPVMATFSLP